MLRHLLTGTLVVLLGIGIGSCIKAPENKPPEQKPPSTDIPTPPAAPPQATPVTPAAPPVAEAIVDGDWLVERLPSEPANLNPITSSDFYATQITSMIFDTLIERDNETLAITPRIAERWEISPDHLTYTFYLRKDATFSDGTPLTANDVKFTYDKIMDPAVDCAHLRNYFQDITKCEVVDASTVRYTASKPYFKHLTVLGSLEILPQHIYGQGDFNTHPNNRKPLGSGPYVLESWDTGQQITLVRNEKYWRKKPPILKRVYKIVTDAYAAFQVLERQELDTMTLTPELYAKRAQQPDFAANFAIHKFYASQYSYVGWNLRRPQFQEKMVRRALTMLMDRKSILETIYRGLGKQVVSEFFVESPEYNNALQPWPFDPAQAKELLKAAGWTDSDGDGILDKAGQKFEFELLIRSSSPEHEQNATVFQEELKRAGIAMSIRPLEWATFLQKVDSRTYDAVILGWSTPPIEEDPYQIWHSSQAEKGSNFVGYINPEADKLMEEARLEFDEQKRIELYHRFDAMLHEDQPYTFLFCIQEIDAVAKRFQNVKDYKFGMDSREWGVPASQQRYH